jgi:hypothetical protein
VRYSTDGDLYYDKYGSAESSENWQSYGSVVRTKELPFQDMTAPPDIYQTRHGFAPTSFVDSGGGFDGSVSALNNFPRLLTPEELGTAIPSDAKWTKIRRSLVSPQVLEEDHRRYEA